MFNSLTGRITGKRDGTLYLQCGGIEWEIAMAEPALGSLPESGEEARVVVYLHHRDDQMKLFGFASEEEREIFFGLTKVDGIGPRQAMRILSGAPADALVTALDAGDVDALSKIPGVGKKTAAKIVLALRGKLRSETRAPSPAYDEMVSALSEMGFDRRQAQEAVASALKEAGSGATAGNEEEIMRAAIVRLSSRVT